MGKGLPGAKFTIMRTAGMGLNLLGLILSIVFGLTQFTSSILMIGPLVGVILFIAFIKLEIDKIDAHRPIFLITAFVLGIGLLLLINFAANIDWIVLAQYYLTFTIAIYAMSICWHYTLSIYKNEKTRFVLGYIGYLILFGIVDFAFVGAISLLPTLIVTFAVGMTLFAERQLISKKLMNYI